MNHRAGFINGEGDGVGIHIDIPRLIWKEKLQEIGLNPLVVDDKEHFVVGHIFITRTKESEAKKTILLKKLEDAGFTVKRSLEDGVREFADWMRGHPETYR